MRIISDLVAYCHAAGGEEFQMFMTHDAKAGVSTVEVSSPIPDLDPAIVQRLTERLSAHRQREVEQNYWELSGESELSGELTLVGMMIDRVNVGYKDGVLIIHAERED